MPRYAGLRRPKGRGGLSVPRAANDNRMGLVQPPLPITRRIAPIPMTYVPLRAPPMIGPFSTSANLLILATELTFGQLPSDLSNDWEQTANCEAWAGYAHSRLGSSQAMCASLKQVNVPSTYYDYGDPSLGYNQFSLYNYHSTTRWGTQYLQLAEAWKKLNPNAEALPWQYPSSIVPLPQSPQVSPRWPRPRCMSQPSVSPLQMPWPQGLPGIPPFVDAQSAAEAGFAAPSFSATIKPNGKAKVKPMKSPSGKPKKPQGKTEPPKGKLGKLGKAIWIGTGAASEGIEILQAAHDALPDWAKPDKHRDAYGNATEDPVPTIPEMIDALVKHGSQIDTAKMIENILNNQIEDFFYGKLSSGVKPFSQSIGHQTGLDRAAGAGGRNVQEDEDNPLLPSVSIDGSSCSIKISW